MGHARSQPDRFFPGRVPAGLARRPRAVGAGLARVPDRWRTGRPDHVFGADDRVPDPCPHRSWFAVVWLPRADPGFRFRAGMAGRPHRGVHSAGPLIWSNRRFWRKFAIPWGEGSTTMRILITGLIGGLVFFLWGAVAHMAL